jgi:hypothetical protein
MVFETQVGLVVALTNACAIRLLRGCGPAEPVPSLILGVGKSTLVKTPAGAPQATASVQ